MVHTQLPESASTQKPDDSSQQEKYRRRFGNCCRVNVRLELDGIDRAVAPSNRTGCLNLPVLDQLTSTNGVTSRTASITVRSEIYAHGCTCGTGRHIQTLTDENHIWVGDEQPRERTTSRNCRRL